MPKEYSSISDHSTFFSTLKFDSRQEDSLLKKACVEVEFQVHEQSISVWYQDKDSEKTCYQVKICKDIIDQSRSIPEKQQELIRRIARMLYTMKSANNGQLIEYARWEKKQGKDQQTQLQESDKTFSEKWKENCSKQSKGNKTYQNKIDSIFEKIHHPKEEEKKASSSHSLPKGGPLVGKKTKKHSTAQAKKNAQHLKKGPCVSFYEDRQKASLKEWSAACTELHNLLKKIIYLKKEISSHEKRAKKIHLQDHLPQDILSELETEMLNRRDYTQQLLKRLESLEKNVKNTIEDLSQSIGKNSFLQELAYKKREFKENFREIQGHWNQLKKEENIVNQLELFQEALLKKEQFLEKIQDKFSSHLKPKELLDCLIFFQDRVSKKQRSQEVLRFHLLKKSDLFKDFWDKHTKKTSLKRAYKDLKGSESKNIDKLFRSLFLEEILKAPDKKSLSFYHHYKRALQVKDAIEPLEQLLETLDEKDLKSLTAYHRKRQNFYKNLEEILGDFNPKITDLHSILHATADFQEDLKGKMGDKKHQQLLEKIQSLISETTQDQNCLFYLEWAYTLTLSSPSKRQVFLSDDPLIVDALLKNAKTLFELTQKWSKDSQKPDSFLEAYLAFKDSYDKNKIKKDSLISSLNKKTKDPLQGGETTSSKKNIEKKQGEIDEILSRVKQQKGLIQWEKQDSAKHAAQILNDVEIEGTQLEGYSLFKTTQSKKIFYEELQKNSSQTLLPMELTPTLQGEIQTSQKALDSIHTIMQTLSQNQGKNPRDFLFPQMIQTLETEGKIWMPGIYTTPDSGHAMIYKLEHHKDKGCVSFTIYNSGEGVEKHTNPKDIHGKHKVYPLLHFSEIPEHLIFQTSQFSQTHFKPGFESVLKSLLVDHMQAHPQANIHQLYAEIVQTLVHGFQAKLGFEPQELNRLTTPRRNSTCTEGCLHPLEASLITSEKDYKKIQTEYQLRILLQAYLAKKDSLDQEPIWAMLLQNAAKKLSIRLIKHFSLDENKEGLNTLFALLNGMQKHLDTHTKEHYNPSFSPYLPPSFQANSPSFLAPLNAKDNVFISPEKILEKEQVPLVSQKIHTSIDPKNWIEDIIQMAPKWEDLFQDCLKRQNFTPLYHSLEAVLNQIPLPDEDAYHPRHWTSSKTIQVFQESLLSLQKHLFWTAYYMKKKMQKKAPSLDIALYQMQIQGILYQLSLNLLSEEKRKFFKNYAPETSHFTSLVKDSKLALKNPALLHKFARMERFIQTHFQNKTLLFEKKEKALFSSSLQTIPELCLMQGIFSSQEKKRSSSPQQKTWSFEKTWRDISLDSPKSQQIFSSKQMLPEDIKRAYLMLEDPKNWPRELSILFESNLYQHFFLNENQSLFQGEKKGSQNIAAYDHEKNLSHYYNYRECLTANLPFIAYRPCFFTGEVYEVCADLSLELLEDQSTLIPQNHLNSGENALHVYCKNLPSSEESQVSKDTLNDLGYALLKGRGGIWDSLTWISENKRLLAQSPEIQKTLLKRLSNPKDFNNALKQNPALIEEILNTSQDCLDYFSAPFTDRHSLNGACFSLHLSQMLLSLIQSYHTFEDPCEKLYQRIQKALESILSSSLKREDKTPFLYFQALQGMYTLKSLKDPKKSHSWMEEHFSHLFYLQGAPLKKDISHFDLEDKLEGLSHQVQPLLREFFTQTPLEKQQSILDQVSRSLGEKEDGTWRRIQKNPLIFKKGSLRIYPERFILEKKQAALKGKKCLLPWYVINKTPAFFDVFGEEKSKTCFSFSGKIYVIDPLHRLVQNNESTYLIQKKWTHPMGKKGDWYQLDVEGKKSDSSPIPPYYCSQDFQLWTAENGQRLIVDKASQKPMLWISSEGEIFKLDRDSKQAFSLRKTQLLKTPSSECLDFDHKECILDWQSSQGHRHLEFTRYKDLSFSGEGNFLLWEKDPHYRLACSKEEIPRINLHLPHSLQLIKKEEETHHRLIVPCVEFTQEKKDSKTIYDPLYKTPQLLPKFLQEKEALGGVSKKQGYFVFSLQEGRLIASQEDVLEGNLYLFYLSLCQRKYKEAQRYLETFQHNLSGQGDLSVGVLSLLDWILNHPSKDSHPNALALQLHLMAILIEESKTPTTDSQRHKKQKVLKNRSFYPSFDPENQAPTSPQQSPQQVEDTPHHTPMKSLQKIDGDIFKEKLQIIYAKYRQNTLSRQERDFFLGDREKSIKKFLSINPTSHPPQGQDISLRPNQSLFDLSKGNCQMDGFDLHTLAHFLKDQSPLEEIFWGLPGKDLMRCFSHLYQIALSGRDEDKHLLKIQLLQQSSDNGLYHPINHKLASILHYLLESPNPDKLLKKSSHPLVKSLVKHCDNDAFYLDLLKDHSKGSYVLSKGDQHWFCHLLMEDNQLQHIPLETLNKDIPQIKLEKMIQEKIREIGINPLNLQALSAPIDTEVPLLKEAGINMQRQALNQSSILLGKESITWDSETEGIQFHLDKHNCVTLSYKKKSTGLSWKELQEGLFVGIDPLSRTLTPNPCTDPLFHLKWDSQGQGSSLLVTPQKKSLFIHYPLHEELEDFFLGFNQLEEKMHPEPSLDMLKTVKLPFPQAPHDEIQKKIYPHSESLHIKSSDQKLPIEDPNWTNPSDSHCLYRPFFDVLSQVFRPEIKQEFLFPHLKKPSQGHSNPLHFKAQRQVKSNLNKEEHQFLERKSECLEKDYLLGKEENLWQEQLSKRRIKCLKGASLNQLKACIEKEEKSKKTTLENIQSNIFSLCLREKTPSHLSLESARKRQALSMQKLTYLFLQNDEALYKDETGLEKTEDILKLKKYISTYLICQREQGLFKSALELIETSFSTDIFSSSQRDILLEKLSKKLSTQFHYNPFQEQLKDAFSRTVLVFEASTAMALTLEQNKMLKKLLLEDSSFGGFQEAILQMKMGGGKTKVLLPLLSYCKAKGDNLAVLMMPQELFKSFNQEIQSSCRDLFHQEAMKLEFHRNVPYSLKNLQDIQEKVQTCIEKRRPLILHEYTPLHLALTFIEWNKQLAHSFGSDGEQLKQKIKILENILSTFREKGDVLIDEADSVLSISKELNYPLGKKEFLDPRYFSLIGGIYQALDQIPIKKNTLKQILQKNRQKDLSAREKEKIKQALSKSLVDLILPWDDLYKEKTLLERLNLCFDTKISPYALEDYFLHKTSDTVEKSLRNLYESQDPYKHLLAQSMTLIREEINHTLHETLEQSALEHYGTDPQKPRDILCIPYHCAKEPMGSSRFSQPLKAINLLQQYYRSQDITFEQCQAWIEKLLSLAASELDASMEKKSLDNTVIGNQFFQLTKKKLSSFQDNNPKKRLAFHKKLNQDKKYQSQILDFFLESFAQKSFYTHGEKLAADAHMLVGLFRSTQGFTGTPWNKYGYHQRLKTVETPGTDGALMDLIAEKKPEIHCLKKSPRVEGILNLCKKKKPLRAIIDVGSCLKEWSNQRVAEKILMHLSKGKFPPKAVLYFDDKTDKLMCLKAGQSPQIIQGTHQSDVLRQTGVDEGDLFVYFDQKHTTGTDITLADDAHALLLMDQKTSLRGLLQGAARLRKLKQRQSLDLVLEVEKDSSDLSLSEVFLQACHNEGMQQIKSDSQAAFGKMYNALREALFENLRLLEKTDLKDNQKKAQRELFCDLLTIQESYDPYTLYGDKKSSRDIREALLEKKEQILTHLEKKCEDLIKNKDLSQESFQALLQIVDANCSSIIEQIFPSQKEPLIVTKTALRPWTAKDQEQVLQEEMQMLNDHRLEENTESAIGQDNWFSHLKKDITADKVLEIIPLLQGKDLQKFAPENLTMTRNFSNSYRQNPQGKEIHRLIMIASKTHGTKWVLSNHDEAEALMECKALDTKVFSEKGLQIYPKGQVSKNPVESNILEFIHLLNENYRYFLGQKRLSQWILEKSTVLEKWTKERMLSKQSRVKKNQGENFLSLLKKSQA